MLVEKKLLRTLVIEKYMMMDFEKTKELYEKIGQLKKFQEIPEFSRYNKELKWYERVKSKRGTGEYYQANELINRELVPPDWIPPHTSGAGEGEGKAPEYPLKHVNGIYRRRIADGSEWITTTQEWIALDNAGNPLNISMDNKECFDDILPIYKVKPENPRERDSKMIRELDHIEHRPKYTLPFSPDNVQKLYDMRNGKCSLVLKDETVDKPPYNIPKLESFKNSRFEELFE